MYEELAKSLRTTVMLYGAVGQEDLVTTQLMKQAADAIEELSLIAESNERNAVRWAETAGKAVEQIPRWIPVTERLPKNEKDVLAYYGFKHDGVLSDQRFIGTLCYFRFDPTPHWQHEGQGKLTVTHWMPLPEPPKEET